jgi:hypothetical protein
MHSEMAEGTYSRGEHGIIEGADHFSPVTDRRHAEVVSGTIEQVVAQARI